jgi:Fe-S-cluster-containing hydrogenase component 2
MDEVLEKPASVVFRRDLCRGCNACEYVCSTYHEGVSSPSLSRIRVSSDDINFTWSVVRCIQCKTMDCYYACPHKDTALRIDSATGATYIDEAYCDGCGLCVEACRLKDKPIFARRHDGAVTYFKCDLCHERAEGPACAEVCNRGALTLKERSRDV